MIKVKQLKSQLKGNSMLIAGLCEHFDLEVNRISETHVICSNDGKRNGAIHIAIDSLVVSFKSRMEFKGDIIELLSYVMNDEKFQIYKKYSFKATITKCQRFLDTVDEDNLEVSLSHVVNATQSNLKLNVAELSQIAQERYANFIEHYHPHWIEEGLSENSQKKFGVRFYLDQNDLLNSRAIIPHYQWDDPERLLGLKGRRIGDGGKFKGYGKYKNFVKGYRVGANLFGLSHTYDAILERNRMLIFESEKSVIQLDTITHGRSYGVAACGKHITAGQMNIIKKIVEKKPDMEVIIAMDNDVKEYESRRMCSSLNALGIENISYIRGNDKRLGAKDSISDSDLFTDLLFDRVKYRK